MFLTIHVEYILIKDTHCTPTRLLKYKNKELNIFSLTICSVAE